MWVILSCIIINYNDYMYMTIIQRNCSNKDRITIIYKLKLLLKHRTALYSSLYKPGHFYLTNDIQWKVPGTVLENNTKINVYYMLVSCTRCSLTVKYGVRNYVHCTYDRLLYYPSITLPSCSLLFSLSLSPPLSLSSLSLNGVRHLVHLQFTIQVLLITL